MFEMVQLLAGTNLFLLAFSVLTRVRGFDSDFENLRVLRA